MSTDPDTILLETEEHMEKALDHLKNELRGVRTGRASPAMVEYLKVDYYGSMTDLKALAAISVPEPTQLLIKPFDAGAMSGIKQAIEKSGLGLNPIMEAKQVRLQIPAMSQERRVKDAARIKKMGEEAKVSIRNVRRDANKHADGLKSTGLPEDEAKTLHDEIQGLLKKSGLSACHYFPNHSVGEVSRFAISKEFRRRKVESKSITEADAKRERHGNLPCLGLIQMLLRQSLELGVEYWAAVMEPQLLRMLAAMGIRFQPVGPLVSYHGLRQPSFCHLPVMVRNMALTRPESWAVVTNNGELMPTRPDSGRELRKVA